MRVLNRQAVRTAVRHTMSRLRALVTVLCVFGLATSIVFAPRPALASLSTQKAHQTVLAVHDGSGTRKPCERAGLRAGIVCHAGVAFGMAAGGAHLAAPASCRTDAPPLRCRTFSAQCHSGSLFRPPRIDA